MIVKVYWSVTSEAVSASLSRAQAALRINPQDPSAHLLLARLGLRQRLGLEVPGRRPSEPASNGS